MERGETGYGYGMALSHVDSKRIYRKGRVDIDYYGKYHVVSLINEKFYIIGDYMVKLIGDVISI